MDWTTFWSATGAGAGVATAFSTGTVVWLQRRNRPEPRWEFGKREQQAASTNVEGAYAGMPYVSVTMVNAGDGTAYHLSVSGVGCAARLVNDRGALIDPLPIVSPGDRIRLRAYLLTQDGWENAVIRLQWTPPPTRLARPVVDLIPVSEGLVVGDDLRSVNRWRSRELGWWQLIQRFSQARSRHARKRAQERFLRARRREPSVR